MKTLFRVLSLAIMLTAFSALSFAQEPTLADSYTKFREQMKAKCGERDAALATGKMIIEKFGNDDLNKEVLDYVRKKVAEIEKTDPRCKLEARYNKTYADKNWSDFLDVSKQVLAMEGDTPLGLDILLTQVSVGFNLADRDKVDTFNNETMNWAKTALQKIQSGKVSQTKNWGVFEPFGSKEAAQSWSNYIIGWMMFNKMNQKNTEALGYFYKSTQVSDEKKKDGSIYVNIGTHYSNEASRIYTEYLDKRKANNNEDNDETKALLALARGTADRSIDAFGRAYKIAMAEAKTPAPAKKALADKLTELYKFRFNMADAKQVDVDKYVNEMVAKPMPDPTTAVTPVVEVKPATTSTVNTTPATTTTTPATTNANTTKPAATTTTKPTTTTKTTNGTTATTTTKPTPAKKPAPKKKGTR